jgi:hypothetical protein
VNLPCPHCARDILVPPELYGQRGLCPHCEAELQFPDARVEAEGAPEDDAERKKQRMREKALSAIVAVVVHTALLLWLAWLIAEKPASAGGGDGMGVGIAELPGESLTATEAGSFDPAPVAVAPAADELIPVEISPPSDLSDTELGVPEVMPSGAAGGPGGDGLDLRPPGAAGGHGGRMKFMGVEGSGERFLIIADRSSSMNGPKLEYVKAEILKTLSDLRPGAKFYVIFYDSTATPMPGNRWVSGRSQAVQAANWIRQIYAQGGTEPLPAFELAFRMQPRPDTIFFMTDGLFSNNVPDAVNRLNNGRPKVVIHAISFIDRSSESMMRQIAEQSGGQYRHVDP